ncbi:uncharacterized protein IL334_002332 [Kwoniella shivajii]|uniref:Autophagy-related protein 14 n=1 Tax=Kwoniella shivajii TaxID=564305 RepID=A0ABZ1CW60_9TREE|nr:hypothetical protein IL334_002332 [Kwoniella shivajii]
MASVPPKYPCCHLQLHNLYCSACLQEGINLHKEALKNIQGQIDAIVSKSKDLLAGVKQPSSSRNTPTRGIYAWKHLRSEVAEREKRCAKLKGKIIINDQTISTVLIKEAISVFGIRKNSVGEWTIAGLNLPSPDAFRLYSSTHINAALLHSIHLLALITAYLSVTLPFTPTSPPPYESRHIGRQVMKANTPFVSTTKWRDKNVLWMSSTASIASKIKSRKSLSASKLFSQPNISAIIAKSMTKHRQFLTSFAVLSFSVAYLAWSQGVPGIGIREGEGEEYRDESDDDNPRPTSRAASVNPDSVLISATSILELIAAVAISPELGHKAHEPGTSRSVRHLGFGLDVAKVIQSVLSADENRCGIKPAEGSGEELSEGWDLLDGTGS